MIINIKKLQNSLILSLILLLIISFSLIASVLYSDDFQGYSVAYKDKVVDYIKNSANNFKDKPNDALLYDKIFKLINSTRPSVPLLKEYPNGKAKEIKLEDNSFVFDEDYLNSLLVIDEKTVKDLKKKHDIVLSAIKNEVDDEYTFGDLDNLKGNGIVMVGGGKYTLLTLIGIQNLKLLGSKLPIEVFFAKEDEYDQYLCETLLPSFNKNSRCSLLYKEIDPKLLESFDISTYQYKILALLISRFENIMYLDSDLYAVENPDYLLESDVFKEKGLVLWPDAWFRTSSPKYYEIAGIEVKDEPQSENKDEKIINFHDKKGAIPDPTVESGAILVNKQMHSQTLLLSLYYNIYGPGYYYPLLTQGGAGEGDKETFIAAATVLNTPYYQTQKALKFFGYLNEKNEPQHKSLGQYDPVKSFHNYKKMLSPGDSDYEEPKLIFMHINYPKLLPAWLYYLKEYINDKNEHIRLYEGLTKELGQDFELRINIIFNQLFCSEYDDSNDGDLKVFERSAATKLKTIEVNQEVLDNSCREIFIPHVQFLRDHPEQT
ncbi:hypothetical protein PACTADRAFT_50356 [Pachysolen tannophilus NRRL Y-2460]|uniref:Glycosyltransferase family 71 protein n=1 Tax=Pachysolen tannophilus NRRL Y-2460 TaxID=669874 RepID=A0A1E4TV71_PACTA|nr:hypothetical protein PACTADRAFT_50356 [Pachysolen tannophilus NRRL Y-2460]